MNERDKFLVECIDKELERIENLYCETKAYEVLKRIKLLDIGTDLRMLKNEILSEYGLTV